MKKALKIKVCGLKNTDNIKDIDALGVDYIGMIFYEKSPRFAGESSFQTQSLNAKKVGVFVNASIEYIADIKSKFGIKVAQLHGSESPEFCKRVKKTGLEVWKVFGIDNESDFSELENYKSLDLFLFDTKSPLHGGTGIKFDWGKLKKLGSKYSFILSGGIGKDDADTIKNLSITGLVGIDLNSKFEITPGLKDTVMLNDFMKNLKSTQ
jgi:phosphoribosylanthranilate isomerase